jgi:DNA polymerase elongation subunit (family B)
VEEVLSAEPGRDAISDEWLWGWDLTPGIVSIWADRDGHVILWRREHGTVGLQREERRFRPWLLLPHLDDLEHLGRGLIPAESASPDQLSSSGVVTYEILNGPGHLRYRVSASSSRILETALLAGMRTRLGRQVRWIGELGDDGVLQLPMEEQYLVSSGQAYFRGLTFDDLHRLQFDLETTGLDPASDRIFLVAVRDSRGLEQVLEVRRGPNGLPDSACEADLIRELADLIRRTDPDILENHNLQGFDLPFLAKRAEILNVHLALGRPGVPGLLQRPASRGYGQVRGDQRETGLVESMGGAESEHTSGVPAQRSDRPYGGRADRGARYVVPGREIIDTLDAVRRYDFAARDLPSHGLKAVARYFGLASPSREYVEGPRIYHTWLQDPDRVKRYAMDDVREVDGLARLLGGAAFALAQMAPRRYERLADAGPATGILDPLIVRAYLRSGEALPAYARGDGTEHTGAALYLFASGVAERIVKADVSSLYPSLMRQYKIGPESDHIGALLALVDRLVVQRLAAKQRARLAPLGSVERHTNEALSAAMKILVNSAYGYLGATGLTRLADVRAANQVTYQGRAVLGLICRELAARGAILLEADTDGVYFSVPASWSEAEERHIVTEVAALLPPLVRLEFEGRYAAMLSHEPKNYCLLQYDGTLILRGVAFRSSRVEPYGEDFLRRAISCLLVQDIVGVRSAYVETVDALRSRSLPTAKLASQLRLTKSPKAYLATRSSRREAAYEALLNNGRDQWKVGEQIKVYRAARGRAALLPEPAESPQLQAGHEVDALRDYDVAYYVRLLRETFAARLARAFTSDDFAALTSDPEQPSLFAPPITSIHSCLNRLMDPPPPEREPDELEPEKPTEPESEEKIVQP